MVTFVFYLAAVVALGTALVAVSHRSPVVNVLSLVVTFFCVAVNYALLEASFLAAAQVLVYTGAILVLFLFVVMLLNAPEVPPATEPRPFQRWLGTIAAAATALVGVLLFLSWRTAPPTIGPGGDAVSLGRLLVGPYLFAFELIAVLLLASLVGAYTLVKRKH